jgi:hypothetical protein
MKDIRALNEGFNDLAIRLEQLEQLATEQLVTRPAPAAPSPPVPSVGRIVHFGVSMLNGTRALPAIIIGVDGTDHTVDLVVFAGEDGPAELLGDVRHATALEGGCWSWPPRVESSSRGGCSGSGGGPRRCAGATPRVTSLTTSPGRPRSTGSIRLTMATMSIPLS